MKEYGFCRYKNLEDAKKCINCRSDFVGKISYQIEKPSKFTYCIFSILPDFSFETEVIFATLIFGIVMMGISSILIKLATILFSMAKTNNKITNNNYNDISNISDDENNRK